MREIRTQDKKRKKFFRSFSSSFLCDAVELFSSFLLAASLFVLILLSALHSALFNLLILINVINHANVIKKNAIKTPKVS